mgnify:CR=1 FL=1
MCGERARFEGWYFKHSTQRGVYSFIPGLSVAPTGEKYAFLQAISPGGSRFLRYAPGEYAADPDSCSVRIGDSFFGPSGACVSVSRDGARIRGLIRYSAFRPIRRSFYCPTAMGPFSYLRFLECFHDVVSLSHGLSGLLDWNGETVDFSGGTGYIERDAGRSFPRAWIWYQSCGFPRPEDCVMLAAARVPFRAGRSFPGLICICSAGGREYRLASYYGGRLVRAERAADGFLICAKQRSLRLEIRVRPRDGHALLAPLLGNMTRTIREYPCCDSRVRLVRGARVLLEGEGRCAGFEQAGPLSDLRRGAGQ